MLEDEDFLPVFLVVDVELNAGLFFDLTRFGHGTKPTNSLKPFLVYELLLDSRLTPARSRA